MQDRRGHRHHHHPDRRCWDEPRPDAREPRQCEAHGRKHLRHPRKSWNQRGSIASICTAISGGGARNMMPCARKTSAKSTCKIHNKMFIIYSRAQTYIRLTDADAALLDLDQAPL